MQNVSFQWADGSAGQLNQLLHWAKGWPLLLVWGDGAAGDLQREPLLRASWHRHARIVWVQTQASAIQLRETIVDQPLRLAQACGLSSLTGMGWALIRPDSYLAARGERYSAAQLQAALNRLATPSQPAGIRSMGEPA